MKNKILYSFLFTFLFSLITIYHPAFAATTTSTSTGTTASSTSPLLNFQIGQSGNLASSVEIFVIITLLSFLPAIVVTMTCYVQIVIVLSLTRQALGTATAPPNQVISGLALILTMFIMAPVGQQIYHNAYQPYESGKISFQQAITTAEVPLKKYMLDNADEKYIQSSADLAKVKITKKADVPFSVALLANLITELHKALGMGAIVMSAFVVIDMIVATILMLFGMFSLPPNVISLPIKIITFLAAGGFQLIIEILVQGIKV